MATISHKKPMISPQLSETVVTSEPSDRRVVPRFRVRFRTVVSVPGTAREGEGTVLDLSLGGCRIDAPLAVQPSTLMELRIYAPDLDWPLMLDAAVVLWVNGTTFGLRFLRLRQAEKERLAKVLADRDEHE
jgi:PilZ domain-containing protein